MQRHRQQLAIIREDDSIQGLSPFNHMSALRYLQKGSPACSTPSPFNHVAAMKQLRNSPAAPPPAALAAKDVSGDRDRRRRRRRRRRRKQERGPKQLFAGGGGGDKENGGGNDGAAAPRVRRGRGKRNGPKTKDDWTPGREARKTKGPPLRPCPSPANCLESKMDDASSTTSPSSSSSGSPMKDASPAGAAPAPIETFVLQQQHPGAAGHPGVKPQWLAVKRDPVPTLALQYADAAGCVKILSIELTRVHADPAGVLCDAIFAQCSAYFVGIQRGQVLRLIQSVQLAN